jgi:hypothetical protein
MAEGDTHIWQCFSSGTSPKKPLAKFLVDAIVYVVRNDGGGEVFEDMILWSPSIPYSEEACRQRKNSL